MVGAQVDSVIQLEELSVHPGQCWAEVSVLMRVPTWYIPECPEYAGKTRNVENREERKGRKKAVGTWR